MSWISHFQLDCRYNFLSKIVLHFVTFECLMKSCVWQSHAAEITAYFCTLTQKITLSLILVHIHKQENKNMIKTSVIK